MSVRADRIIATSASGIKEVITGFDPSLLKAPFLLRCEAMLIDYIVLVSGPVISLLIGRALGDDGRKLLTGELSNAGWMVAILLALTNFIIFPMFTGQSIGKMLTGLRIVNTDGGAVSIGSLLIRHLVGYFLTLLTLGLGFLLAIVNLRGRTLHDFLAGTIVVYGHRRTKPVKSNN